MERNVPTYVPSVEALITPSPGHAVPNQLTSDDFLSAFIDSQKFLSYTDFLHSIVHCPFMPSLHSLPLLFEKITTPYDAHAFHFALNKHDLLSLYPLLSSNLLSGFLIGHMPALTHSTIIPNHISCKDHMDKIQEYLKDKVKDNQMSSPFSQTEAESILRGPFFLLPLLVAVQSQAPGVPDKIRICRHLSKDSHFSSSVNSHVSKDAFPTHFDTVSHVADIVCAVPFSSILHSLFIHYSLFAYSIHHSTICYSLFIIH